MSGPPIITFLTDFGWAGGYVAVCEAVVARVAPTARVFHISHEVPVGDIAAGALTLQRIAPSFPPAVHLALVDPGVGTNRRPVVLRTSRGDVLVGPDNGLLLPAADALGGLDASWCLDVALVRARAGLPADEVSFTFHGRDIFAPAAALVAVAADPASLGSPVDPAGLIRLTPPTATPTDDGAVAQVIEVDRFGNVGLALRFADLAPQEGSFLVEVVGEDLPEWTARVVRTYGELGSGELGVFRDSWGQVALALKSASAAQLLSLDCGMKVRLTAVPDTGAPSGPA
jgi:S-adenosylmethionine hydrolase